MSSDIKLNLVDLNEYSKQQQMTVKMCRNMHIDICREKCANRALCDTVMLEQCRKAIKKLPRYNKNNKRVK